MWVLRVTVVLFFIAALLVLVYYIAPVLLAVWRELTTLSYMPATAQSEQKACMLLVFSVIFGVIVMLLLVVIVTVLQLSRRLL